MNFKTYDKNVSVLIDDLPDFDKVQAQRLCDYISGNGFNAVPIDCATVLCKEQFRQTANIFVIPQCECVPAELMQPINDFVGRGGAVLCLGGPMFYDNIISENGKYVKGQVPEGLLDATFIPENDGKILLEGIAPSYKVYKAETEKFYAADSFGREPFLLSHERCDMICPSPRNHGIGHFDRRERFIPIVYGENNNVAAFFMLSQKEHGGHDGVITRPGYVIPTIKCRAYAGIGIKRADILSLDGAGELIISMISRLAKGLWLFESGIDCFRVKKGKAVRLGCSVMNCTLDYKRVEVEFLTEKGAFLSKELISHPFGVASFEKEICVDELLCEDGNIICRLKYDGVVVDEIKQYVQFKKPVVAAREDFVSVSDGKFFLHGKPFQAVGMNYWQSNMPSFEPVNYWLGMFDSTVYDPKIVERDLTAMQKLGINCIMTRNDTLELSRMNECFIDFIERLRAHDMKLCISFPLVESPTHYDSYMFKEFLEKTELIGEPVLMAHDITWECGMHYMWHFKDAYLDEWNAWVKKNYGSVENATQDWGFSPGVKNGVLACPTREQMENDGEHRIFIAAYRRFFDENIGRLWLDTINDMRSIDPDHLYTYRQGPPTRYHDMSYTATHVATDFVSPEGYSIQYGDEGHANACFSTELLRSLSGGQPVFWMEFGKTVCGLRWTGLEWDHDAFAPYPEKVEDSRLYLDMFNKILLDIHVEGSSPWWWGSGFRRTEMSDCSFMEPNGNLREWAYNYSTTAEKLKNTVRRTPTEYITVDRDVDARGLEHICGTVGVKKWLDAVARGEYLGIKLDGEGTDTESLPDIAVGNAKYTGKNPHKYLIALFKSCEKGANGIKVEFFNTGCAKWLSANTYVKLTCADKEYLSPIMADTSRMGIAKTCFDFVPNESFFVEMCTEKAGEFGERMEVVI